MTDKRVAGGVRLKVPARPRIYQPPEIGQKIGHVTVVGFDRKRRRWVCRCDCGTESLRGTNQLQAADPMCRKCRREWVRVHPWGS